MGKISTASRAVGGLALTLVVLASAFSIVSLRADADTAADAADPVHVALQAGKPTVAEFGSNRCNSCKQMKIVLARLIEDHGDRVGVVEVDLFSPEGRGLVSRYGIQMMPTQIFFDAKGQEIGRHLGPISIDDILASLSLDAPGARGTP